MFGCFYKNELENKMPGMTIENIAAACEGTFVGDRDLVTKEIAGAVTDSRQVQKDYLFIPIKGARVDGHDFIPQVFEKGALVVLSDHALPEETGPYILVSSTTEAMKKIAAFYRTQLSCKVVGITGSVGKTSTKEMIASVLEQRYKVLKTEGNFNNEIGLPLTIFKIRAKHEVTVLEMGISDFGEMHRLAAMARPDIGVITNIGLCHLENLGTRDGILQAKTEMFDHLQVDGTVILNGDDDKLSTKQEVNGKPVIFYGVGADSALISKRYLCDRHRKSWTRRNACKDPYTTGDFDAQIPIPGEHNVYNALAGTAVGLQLGLSIREIAQGIASVQTIAGRTNLLHVKGMTVIDDCYNANPVSMKASIDVLAHTSGRRIAVLGDMGELGAEEKELHRNIGKAVAASGIDALFCAGTLAEEYAREAKANPECEVHYKKTREEMTEELLAYVKEGDTVLVKASHFMEFPKVVEALTKE